MFVFVYLIVVVLWSCNLWLFGRFEGEYVNEFFVDMKGDNFLDIFGSYDDFVMRVDFG